MRICQQKNSSENRYPSDQISHLLLNVNIQPCSERVALYICNHSRLSLLVPLIYCISLHSICSLLRMDGYYLLSIYVYLFNVVAQR